MTEILFITIAIVVTIQLVWWIVFIRWNRTKVRNSGQQPANPVSIIVCAHDEEMNLRRLLPLLLAQQHPALEIIIVNDRSNDGTYDFLLEQSALHPSLKVVTVRNKPDAIPGKKFALTLGIKAATHDIVLLTDADCHPASDQWAKRMSESFRDGVDIVLGISPYESKPGFLNEFIRYESNLTALQYVSLANAGVPYMGVGRNLAYRRKIFFESKGFNAHIHVASGDDDLFVNAHANKQNTVTCIAPEATVFSIPKTNWNDYFHQKKRHLSVGRHYRITHRALLSIWIVSNMLIAPALAVSLLFPGLYWLLLAFPVRWISMILALHPFSKSTGGKITFGLIPVLDIVYSLYFLLMAPVALFTRQTQWKK